MQVNMEGRGERMNSVRNKCGTGHRDSVQRGKTDRRVHDARGEMIGASHIEE
jgi:hypothetical protein